MYNIIYSEILKLKRSKILFLILVPALIIPSISLNGSSVEIVSLYGERWRPFLAKMQLLTCFYSPIFITIFSCYIFIREYRENTISGMLTYPISRMRILYSKSILILPIILFQFLLISLFCIFAGWILHLGNPPVGVLLSILRVIMLSAVLHFALSSTVILVSIYTKNIIFTTIFGIITFFLSLLLLQTKYSAFFPWCFPSLAIMKIFGISTLFEYDNIFKNFNGHSLPFAFAIYSATIMISFTGCMIRFKNSKVG